MSTKHTKGPWKVGYVHNKPCDGFDGSTTDTAYFITEKGGYQDLSEVEANARLISAAPELLALAIDLAKLLEDAGYGAKSTDLDAAAVDLRILVNKLNRNEK